ncbi:hypothetical protein R3P38DRAFT_3298261, partial [Favolaschia claudopus]
DTLLASPPPRLHRRRRRLPTTSPAHAILASVASNYRTLGPCYGYHEAYACESRILILSFPLLVHYIYLYIPIYILPSSLSTFL